MRYYMIAVAMLVAMSAFALKVFYDQQEASDTRDIRSVPLTIGEWTGKEEPLANWEYNLLRTTNATAREYTDRRGRKISLFIVYSETNRMVFHPPEVCMIGNGATTIGRSVETVSETPKKITANKLVTDIKGLRQLTLYAYKAKDLYTHNFYLQQATFVVKQMLAGRVEGATIRVSMPLVEDEATTVETLKEFMREIAKYV
jgi:EpsI family protein